MYWDVYRFYQILSVCCLNLQKIVKAEIGIFSKRQICDIFSSCQLKLRPDFSAELTWTEYAPNLLVLLFLHSKFGHSMPSELTDIQSSSLVSPSYSTGRARALALVAGALHPVYNMMVPFKSWLVFFTTKA